jgi:quercetin dioxygenase-like cupin family protein
VKVARNNFKVLLENEHVRVLDFHSKSGEKIPMHSHPAYVTYAISGSGKTTFHLCGWQGHRRTSPGISGLRSIVPG